MQSTTPDQGHAFRPDDLGACLICYGPEGDPRHRFVSRLSRAEARGDFVRRLGPSSGYDARCGECPWSHRPFLGWIFVYRATGTAGAFQRKHRVKTSHAQLGSRTVIPAADAGWFIDGPVEVTRPRGHVMVVDENSVPDDSGVVYLRSTRGQGV